MISIGEFSGPKIVLPNKLRCLLGLKTNLNNFPDEHVRNIPPTKNIFISHFYPFCLIYSDFMSHFCGPSPNSLISAKEDGKPYLFIYLLNYLFIHLFIYFRLVNSSKQHLYFWDLELVSSATGCRLLPAAAPWGDGFQWSDPTVPGVSEWSKTVLRWCPLWVNVGRSEVIGG